MKRITLRNQNSIIYQESLQNIKKKAIDLFQT